MEKKDNKKYYWNEINVRKILPLMVKKIIEISHPEKIILFGSYAKGTESRDSDIDLLIVKDKIESKIKETLKIRRSLKNFVIPKDIILITKEDFEYYSKEWINSIFAEARRYGRVLYEKKRV